jgi:hypothetical protein
MAVPSFRDPTNNLVVHSQKAYQNAISGNQDKNSMLPEKWGSSSSH